MKSRLVVPLLCLILLVSSAIGKKKGSSNHEARTKRKLKDAENLLRLFLREKNRSSSFPSYSSTFAGSDGLSDISAAPNQHQSHSKVEAEILAQDPNMPTGNNGNSDFSVDWLDSVERLPIVRKRGFIKPNFNWRSSSQSSPSLGRAAFMHTMIGKAPLPLGEAKIFGGKEKTIEKYPYQLQLGVNGSHFCGAAIIGRNWAITAAHCLFDRQSSQRLVDQDLTVRAGTSILNNGGSLHHVKSSTIHGKFDNSGRSFDYDIALIKVIEPFRFSRRVRNISLAKKHLKDGTRLRVSGWGTLGNDDVDLSTMLRSVDVLVTNQELCSRAFEVPITERMICAGDENGGFCEGDGGGPLVHGNKLVGIISFGPPVCNTTSTPGVYTRISHMRTWISRNCDI